MRHLGNPNTTKSTRFLGWPDNQQQRVIANNSDDMIVIFILRWFTLSTLFPCPDISPSYCLEWEDSVLSYSILLILLLLVEVVPGGQTQKWFGCTIDLTWLTTTAIARASSFTGGRALLEFSVLSVVCRQGSGWRLEWPSTVQYGEGIVI